MDSQQLIETLIELDEGGLMPVTGPDYDESEKVVSSATIEVAHKHHDTIPEGRKFIRLHFTTDLKLED